VAVATGAAAGIPGTIVNEVVRRGCGDGGVIRIGHPTGVIEIDARVQTRGRTPTLARAAVLRTARRIMDGTVYVSTRIFA
jgi:2-methylaconitate cis-trans-isomerase PrpF